MEMGGKAGGNTPAEFSSFITAERARWEATVKAANLTATN